LSAVEFKKLGVKFKELKAPFSSESLGGVKVLALGRQALDSEEALKGLARLVREGLNVLVLEQSQQALRNRLGFRTNDPAPRKAWMRVPSHPLFKGLTDDSLSFWRGSSTMLEPYPVCYSEYPYDMGKQAYVDWHGFKNKHVWKWGNTHAVASALVEKPHIGNFTPLADCGFDLSFAPLMEYQEGKGRILLCQFDVSSRTEEEPAALSLLANALAYLSSAPSPEFKALKADVKAAAIVEPLGIASIPFDAASPGSIVAIAAKESLASVRPQGASSVALVALDGDAISKASGIAVKTSRRMESSCVVAAGGLNALKGLGSADFYWRGELEIDALDAAAEPSFSKTPNGSFGSFEAGGTKFLLCQWLPTSFDPEARPHVKLSWLKAARSLRQILCNAGADSKSPLLEYLETPPPKDAKPRWLSSYYLNAPEADDDPYRYQHW